MNSDDVIRELELVRGGALIQPARANLATKLKRETVATRTALVLAIKSGKLREVDDVAIASARAMAKQRPAVVLDDGMLF